MARDRSGARDRRRSVHQRRESPSQQSTSGSGGRGVIDRVKQLFGAERRISPISSIGGDGSDVEEDDGRNRDRDPTPAYLPSPGGPGPIQDPGDPAGPQPPDPPEPDPDPPDLPPGIQPPDDGGGGGGGGDPDPEPPEPDASLVNVTGCSGVPSEASPGGFINVDINLENRGGVDAQGDLTVTLGGDTVVSESVDIDAGASGEPNTVGFDAPNQPGDYQLSAELGNIGRQ